MNPTNSVHNSADEGHHSTAHRVAEAASILLGLLLLFSAGTKIASPGSFLDIIGQFHLLPSSLVLPASAAAVALELTLGLLFLSGIFRRVAAWLNLALVVVFIALMAEAIRRGFEHCGCFGEVLRMPPSREIWIDVFLLGLTLIVLWRGRDRVVQASPLWHALAWGSFSLGVLLFLVGAPVADGSPSARGEMDAQALHLLDGANPPLRLPQDGLLFFFSADCDHCWAFAGGVQMTADRLEDFEVHGITFSGEPSLGAFREAFSPDYPIHRISAAAFRELMPVWPGAIWLEGGEVARVWSGFVPSHWELAERGGYRIRSADDPVHGGDPETGPSPAVLFGGPASGRH